MPISPAYLASEVANEYGSNTFTGTRFCPSCGIQMSGGYKHYPSCLLLSSALSIQTPSFVQAATPIDSTFNSGNITQILLPNQTAGNLNLIGFGWVDTVSTIVSITDSAGNTYSTIGSIVRGATSSAAIAYCNNILVPSPVPGIGSMNAITVVLNNSVTYRTLHAIEYSGVSLSGALDANAGNSGSGTTASVSVTTLNANDLVVAFVNGNSGTLGAAGQTQRSVTAPDGSGIEDIIVANAGPQNMTWAQSSGTWIALAVAFKPGKFSPIYPGANLHV